MADPTLPYRLSTLPLEAVWTNPQARDLLAGRPEVSALYGWSLDPAAQAAAIAARRQQTWRAPAADLAAALRAAHQRRGLTAAQDANLTALADPGTLVVVTGQQPGLFGGPLYSVYKALTAVLEAARLSAAGQRAVPVFWVAGEDDDFAEVRSTWLLDQADQPRLLSLAEAPPAGASVGGWVAPPDDLARLLDEARAALPETDAASAAVAQLAVCWSGQGLAAAFAEWLSRLLGGRGLLLLDPTEPALRALAAPFFERMLDRPLLATESAAAVGERLVALGYEVPTHRTAGLCPFYLYQGQVRQRLWETAGDLVTATGDRVRLADLRELARTAPTRFSTGLLLRPVLQDYLLPTAGFVVGPGELAYVAQVGPTYDAFDLPRPCLVPRHSASLVEPRIARHLTAYDLTVTDAWDDPAALAARVSREAEGGATAALFAAATDEVSGPLDRLREHVAGLDASLAGAAEGVANRLRSDLQKLQEKAQRAIRQRNDTLQRRLAAVCAHLGPGGGPQERRLGAVPWLARYGDAWVDLLLAAFAEAGTGCHAVIRIEP